MTDNAATMEPRADGSISASSLAEHIRNHYQALRALRRGVCLLAAGAFPQAAESFAKALSLGCKEPSLATYLAGYFLAQGRPAEAAATLARMHDESAASVTSRIRQALCLWKAGNVTEAVRTLREALRIDPESAEAHFQLGVVLCAQGEYDEAEMRFTQALSIDRDHTDARVHLGLCFAARKDTREALKHLQQAQARRPFDPSIGLWLAQAARAARQQGHAVVGLRLQMPDVPAPANDPGIRELARVVEAEPDFVDAFLSIPPGEVDEGVFAVLLATLYEALERQPEHAELHYHCGRVLARLGRHDDAIHENERAVALNPRFTRALIELGKLYASTDRAADAATRLEQAIDAGARYADVYFLLGNLYCEMGRPVFARSAYTRALHLNRDFEPARAALASLPA